MASELPMVFTGFLLIIRGIYMEFLFTRRSIRKYKHKDVSDDIVKQIVKAGMNAPSAGNQQPWHFIIIKDREILDEIPEIHPYSKMIKDAPVAICICGDRTQEKHKDYWVQDCSAATLNILLAIESVGLGGVWLGVYPREERVAGIKKLLNIPEHIVPLSIVPIGYPDEQKDKNDKYDETIVHYNKWGNKT